MAEQLKVVTAYDVIKQQLDGEGTKRDEAQRRMEHAFHNVLLKGRSSRIDRALVLTWLMDKGHVFESYGQHNASAYAMEGKRELVLAMIHMMGWRNDTRAMAEALREISAADRELQQFQSKEE